MSKANTADAEREGPEPAPVVCVVVLSYRPALLEALRTNIAASIGVPYELLVLDNGDGRYRSMAVAYNEGARRATAPIVCFVHEDVAFKSEAWGLRLAEHLERDPRIGLIGVIGSKIKSYQPTSHTNIIEGERYKCGSVNAPWPAQGLPSGAAAAEDAVCVDGLFLALPRRILERIRFDEVLITGFHGYDLDISLQVHLGGARVIAARDIAMDHFSKGNRTRAWYETNRAISRKWGRLLPTASRDLRLSAWRLFLIEWRTIRWLAGPNRFKNLAKVPLWTLCFLARPAGRAAPVDLRA